MFTCVVCLLEKNNEFSAQFSCSHPDKFCSTCYLRLSSCPLCRNTTKRNGFYLFCIPKELVTLEMCLAAVSRCGYALEYVPEDMKTLEVCIAAVANCGCNEIRSRG